MAVAARMTYASFKLFIEDYSGLEPDALHIHFAILIYIVAMAVFRKSRRSRIPWFVVLGFELVNEAHDLSVNWEEGPEWALSGSGKDLWNTMLWPTVLLFVGRYTSWFEKKRRHADPPPAKAGPETA